MAAMVVDHMCVTRRPATPDEELLAAEMPSVATELTDDDRVARMLGELDLGFERLRDLGPAVSLFGSARTPVGHPEYELARETARRLGEAGFAIITGAGPGAMEAANRGAREAGVRSVGLNIELPLEQGANPYIDELYEALTLVQTGKIEPFPIILMIGRHWRGLLRWMRDELEAHGRISKGDLELLHVCDDPEEAVALVSSAAQVQWKATVGRDG
jgi:predicted Rossmann-fold nucleotide-binding protein